MGKYDSLNEQQFKAVKTTEGPLLILAGAGSGKTRVLTHRIAYLVDDMGVNPWNILAITFTNKAAGEMRERVDKIVGFGADQIWVSTFHSACVRILRRHIDRLGYENNFTIYDADDQKSLIKDICKKLDIDPKQISLKSIINAISSAKDEMVGQEEFALQSYPDYNRSRIASVYADYQASLKRNNALDFDDIICKTVELFKENPDVLDGYQERFRYIMVDEYQDTNTAQFELIRLLSGKYHNLCVVGDDDQSIYKFRGANIRNILDFEKVYPEANVIRLEQNYRSTQVILDAANSVIRNNRGRKSKTMWTQRGAGDKIVFRQFDTAYEEAEYIAKDIGERASNGSDYKDFAVLYRTNAQARLLEEAMVMAGIPYNVVGGVNFYSRKEIKDILAYLKTIDNGRDDMAVNRILNIPRRGIGAASVAKVEEFASCVGIGFYDALKRADEIEGLGRTRGRIEEFVSLIETFREDGRSLRIDQLIEEILDKIDYEGYLKSVDDEEVEERILNVDELISKAADFEENSEEKSLSEFLEEVALVADIDDVDEESNRVLLMTLHSAKGLEFPHVYLSGMEEGMFPGQMAIDSADESDMEEERRLAYVGITRAMNELTVTSARTRMIRGEIRYNQVSRFVTEIPKELMDEGRDVRPRATLRPKTTPRSEKPFITQGIEGLNRLAGISKGADTFSETPDYKAGDRVSHVKYGEGEVLNIEKEPRDYKVTVMFDRFGQKIMYASFAKLRKISD